MAEVTGRVSSRCKAVFPFEETERQCGSRTKHSTGYCYGHRQELTRRLRAAYDAAKAQGSGPGVPRADLPVMR